MFLNRDGNFKDHSLVSGADFREDGRGFVLFDYDRDGWLDLGVTSPNHPRFRVVKNNFKSFQDNPNGFVELELVGGQTSNQPSNQWSPRDPFGARVIATIEGKTTTYQLSCGEGLSIQNAKRIHIGLGSTKEIQKLEVIWPSGKKTTRGAIAAGERITLFEDPAAQIDLKTTQ